MKDTVPFINKFLVGNALTKLKQMEDDSIDLVITSPPYWNAVVYDKDINTDYETYLNTLTEIFSECSRVLRPNGKMAINTPIMPVPQTVIKQDVRHLKDISADLSDKILTKTCLNLFSVYIWQKQTSKLMFGSYPYPGNLLENNTIEFIKVYVKPGKSKKYPKNVKENEKLKKHEWIDLIQQVWFMIPEDISRKKNHPAPYPEKLPARLMRMFSCGSNNSFKGDIVLDPFDSCRILLPDDLKRILELTHGPKTNLQSEFIRMVSDRDVLIRLQNNIKIRALSVGNKERVLKTLLSMTLVAPTNVDFLAELALMEASEGNYKSAIDRLNNFIKRQKDSKDVVDIENLLVNLKRRLN